LGNSRTSKNVQSLDTLHLIKLDEPTKNIRQHLNTMLSSRKRKGKNLKRKRKSGTEIERERERKRERKRERETNFARHFDSIIKVSQSFQSLRMTLSLSLSISRKKLKKI
jgi:hypothetical protein